MKDSKERSLPGTASARFIAMVLIGFFAVGIWVAFDHYQRQIRLARQDSHPIVRHAESPVPTSPPERVCLTEDVDLARPKPVHPNAREVRAYLASYNAPEIRGLRHEFDAYRSGEAGPETVRSLRPYGASLVSDRFFVFSSERGLVGGYNINIQFRHHPDAMYTVWLYMLGGVEPSIRAFKVSRCTAAEQRWMAVSLAPMFALGDDGSLITSATSPPH